jgi:quinol monooxygenase YgiN
LLEQFVTDSRNDPGVKYFTLITWDPTTNHFQLIEVFQSMRAFDAHVSAAHTVDFRNALQPFIGAPYDERLYRAFLISNLRLQRDRLPRSLRQRGAVGGRLRYDGGELLENHFVIEITTNIDL